MLKTSFRRIILVLTLFCIIFLMGCASTTIECTSTASAREQFKPPAFKSLVSIPVRNISLNLGNFTSFDNQIVSALIADSALKIASRILSSEEFQSNLYALDFKFENHCINCGENSPSRNERIPGLTILDSLFRKSPVILNLFVNPGRCKGALGSTCPNSNQINSNYKAIQCDMSNLPFEYAYAVHLCHEFAHTVCYCHTDHDDDVAEKIGWIAYYIVLNWLKPKV